MIKGLYAVAEKESKEYVMRPEEHICYQAAKRIEALLRDVDLLDKEAKWWKTKVENLEGPISTKKRRNRA